MRNFLRTSLAAFVLLASAACTKQEAINASVAGAAAATPAIVASTTARPADAKTVLEATQAADLTWKLLGVYVTSGKADRAVLEGIEKYAPPVHAALKAAQDAQRAGNNAGIAAALSAFNAALTALRQYEASKGVPNS